MRLFNKENKNKETHRLPMGQRANVPLRSTRLGVPAVLLHHHQLLPPAIR